MAITRETVLHVAKLARLELAPDEVENMQRDLGNILGYVEQLAALDTDGVPETSHVAANVSAFRADAVQPSLPNADALAAAPRHAEGGFAVPAFVDD
jgi:aspartyl-tRNA(Asn)/glutamyl-tRNA(Gln) amidotransferase subunit C